MCELFRANAGVDVGTLATQNVNEWDSEVTIELSVDNRIEKTVCIP